MTQHPLPPRLADLKRQLLRGRAQRIHPAGLEGDDLPGVELGRVHEILPAHPGEAAAMGFVLCLLAGAGGGDTRPLMWITTHAARREVGRLYAPGIIGAGLDPGRLIQVIAPSDREALWVMEQALRSGALAGVAGEAGKVAFTPSRRLSLAASSAGTPLFLLRPWDMTGTSAAATRWRVGPRLCYLRPVSRARTGHRVF